MSAKPLVANPKANKRPNQVLLAPKAKSKTKSELFVTNSKEREIMTKGKPVFAKVLKAIANPKAKKETFILLLIQKREQT